MPKKSNKTAHVLSLLTTGAEPQEGQKDESAESNAASPPFMPEINVPAAGPAAVQPVIAGGAAEPQKAEVIVEMPGGISSDFLSELVKADLEKELGKHLDSQAAVEAAKALLYSEAEKLDSLAHDAAGREEDTGKTEETVFITKFGTETVKSQAFVLEDFNDEDDEVEENVHMEEKINAPAEHAETKEAPQATRVLHNLAEDVIKIKVPEVMKSFNMCMCQDCINDVMALTLNNIKPLYKVTDKGQLFQKLASYEQQYGTDITSEITKACLRVKMNPNH